MIDFEFQNKTKQKSPISTKIFLEVCNVVFKKNYNLSLVFVGNKKAKELNQKYRGKKYIPNVLSFELDKKNGEIFINPLQAKKEFHKFDMNYKNYILFLFIHASLHLKGFDHGKKMELQEKKLFQKFKK